MKKTIIATLVLALASSTAFANGQSNAHDYQPGATNNTERLADIDPNYELTLPSEKEGYTMYDNPYMSDGGTYSTYVKPNPTDDTHVADDGSLKITHGEGGVILTEYTTKNGQDAFSVMCGYTSGPSFWADGKPANVCKDAQALAIALEAKGEWEMKPMTYTAPPARIVVDQ
ncbi:hypothetical protein [uncultured Vibrio sp.]|uniref:hypothetical protein n=1 Tax=uncultured Vibrio sp. TaxID=114054 RepID=UPI00091451EC|nr:hypothetical protein [uncultured Vibrio sp.]OIQ26455.1 MAG: hypothetical protein BM561_01475 [Vibrio sp. MedPE-SWchi]